VRWRAQDYLHWKHDIEVEVLNQVLAVANAKRKSFALQDKDLALPDEQFAKEDLLDRDEELTKLLAEVESGQSLRTNRAQTSKKTTTRKKKRRQRSQKILDRYRDVYELMVIPDLHTISEDKAESAESNEAQMSQNVRSRSFSNRDFPTLDKPASFYRRRSLNLKDIPMFMASESE